MAFSHGEFDSILFFVDGLLNGFSLIATYLTYSINDLLDVIGIAVNLPSWIGGDMTLLAYMVGVGLPTYMAYQFITWLLNVIT